MTIGKFLWSEERVEHVAEHGVASRSMDWMTALDSA
jgi:hypothetical protein